MVNLSEQHLMVELNCGCKINDASGEIAQECLPHKQGNFIQ